MADSCLWSHSLTHGPCSFPNPSFQSEISPKTQPIPSGYLTPTKAILCHPDHGARLDYHTSFPWTSSFLTPPSFSSCPPYRASHLAPATNHLPTPPSLSLHQPSSVHCACVQTHATFTLCPFHMGQTHHLHQNRLCRLLCMVSGKSPNLL